LLIRVYYIARYLVYISCCIEIETIGILSILLLSEYDRYQLVV